MKKYLVVTPELHYNYIEVIADSEDEAKEAVKIGEGESVDLVFSHIMESIDSKDWDCSRL